MALRKRRQLAITPAEPGLVAGVFRAHLGLVERLHPESGLK
jgi:hypothetical protein